MSKIGRKPVPVPSGVIVTETPLTYKVKGPNGEIDIPRQSHISIKIADSIVVSRDNDIRQARANHGLVRSLLANAVAGVTAGFRKELSLVGVGYRAKLMGKTIDLSLGFSHPVHYTLPEGVVAEVPDQTTIVVKGADKQKVGQAAAEIRAFRPPEPYKGKGVRYKDENVRRKAGKAGAK